VHGHHFGADADGDLLRRKCADGQAHGAVDALEAFPRNTFLLEFRHNTDDLALGADQGDIARSGGDRQRNTSMSSRWPRVTMNEIRRGVDRQLRKDFLERRGDDLFGLGKTLAVGERLAVVDNGGVETEQARDLGQALRDVAGAKEERAELRFDGFDEDFQLASADQPFLVGRVVAQVKLSRRGCRSP